MVSTCRSTEQPTPMMLPKTKSLVSVFLQWIPFLQWSFAWQTRCIQPLKITKIACNLKWTNAFKLHKSGENWREIIIFICFNYYWSKLFSNWPLVGNFYFCWSACCLTGTIIVVWFRQAVFHFERFVVVVMIILLLVVLYCRHRHIQHQFHRLSVNI